MIASIGFFEHRHLFTHNRKCHVGIVATSTLAECSPRYEYEYGHTKPDNLTDTNYTSI